MFLAMGECLPRDDSPAMHSCDAAKHREFWLFPLLYVLAVAGSIWRRLRGSGNAWFLAVMAGPIALIALIIIGAMFR